MACVKFTARHSAQNLPRVNRMNRKQKIGKKGEEKACSYLKRHGYELLDRNYHMRGGELDIIAKDGEELVFVEVKTRTDQQFGMPAEAVTKLKQQHLIHAARHYIHQKHLYDLAARFDVIEVLIHETNLFHKITVNHIKNAFMLS